MLLRAARLPKLAASSSARRHLSAALGAAPRLARAGIPAADRYATAPAMSPAASPADRAAAAAASGHRSALPPLHDDLLTSQPSLMTRGKAMGRAGPKMVSAAEAVSHIPSGSRVYVHGASMVPTVLLDALAERDDVQDVELMHLHIDYDNPCTKKHPDRYFSNNLFVGAHERKNVAEGRGSYIPIFLSDMGRMMRTNVTRPDVCLLNVSPPDAHGFVTLGAEVCTALPAAETAPLLIAQINPAVPRTRGTTFVPLAAFDYAVDLSGAPVPVRAAAAGGVSDVERRIGEHIAALVPDGATLQMGIGAVPNAVLSCLHGHKHLGVHTEMFSDGAIDLIKAGVIDNAMKRYQRGRVVTSFVVGSQRLYDFIDDNPEILFQEAAVTNDPVIIGSNPKVCAINSALAVDLTGQVAADSWGSYQVSGVGGQVDFERGAAISPGGIPVIALPSTNTKDGTSKIVPWFKEGTGVVTTRYHVHYVVTEWGVAELFGRNYHERARRLIEIAHPDHRGGLERQAFERFGIKAWRV